METGLPQIFQVFADPAVGYSGSSDTVLWLDLVCMNAWQLLFCFSFSTTADRRFSSPCLLYCDKLTWFCSACIPFFSFCCMLCGKCEYMCVFAHVYRQKVDFECPRESLFTFLRQGHLLQQELACPCS